MESRRAQRISETLREELAELVGYELKDPRLVGVTVTEAHLSPDGRHVHVLVALRGSEAEHRSALDALEHARNHLRREVASRLRLFRAPEIHFAEASKGSEDRIEQLLKRIHKSTARAPAREGVEQAPVPGEAVQEPKKEDFPKK
jgi:ribosome-binding factor A